MQIKKAIFLWPLSFKSNFAYVAVCQPAVVPAVVGMTGAEKCLRLPAVRTYVAVDPSIGANVTPVPVLFEYTLIEPVVVL